MKRWQIGIILGVEIWLTQTSLYLSLLLWLVFSGAAAIWLNYSIGPAIFFGLAAVFLHWFGEIFHQLGHAWVARRLGYPMQRMVTWMVLAASRYPKNEPALPAMTHIKRALGGPAASLLLTVLSGLLLLILPSGTGILFTLAAFVFVENLLVFFLGAFLPLGFTDGSTLLTWWPRRHENTP